MQLRYDETIKQQLLAISDEDNDSDNSSVASNESDFGMSSAEESIEAKTENKAKVEPLKLEKSSAAKCAKSPSEDDEAVAKGAFMSQQTPLDYSNKTEARLSPNGESVKDAEAKKKRIKRDSIEREIFKKSLLEGNENNSDKPKASNSPSASTSGSMNRNSKLRNDGDISSENQPHTEGTLDVTMFENKKMLKEADLNKHFEKRAIAGTSISVSTIQTKPAVVANEEDWISLSSDSDSEMSAQPCESRIPKRKKMLTEEELQEETKRAQKEETQRVERLKKKNAALSQMMSQRLSQEPSSQNEVILDYDPKSNITIKVSPKLVGYLKDHQKEGIKFMYDTCYGSIADEVKTESGCILAHW